MATPAIEREIAKYVHQLSPHQQKAVLSVVKTFVDDKKDWWDSLSEEQLSAIKEAEAELDEGYTTHAGAEKTEEVAIKQNLCALTWSPKAFKTYYNIIVNIEEKFGEPAVQKFVRRTLKILDHVSRAPRCFVFHKRAGTNM